jgi:hypothetical protein
MGHVTRFILKQVALDELRNGNWVCRCTATFLSSAWTTATRLDLEIREDSAAYEFDLKSTL